MADGRLHRRPGDSRFPVDPQPSLGDGRQRRRVRGLIRWRYVAPRLLLAVAVWAFFAYGFDPLLRRGVVAGTQGLIGTQADVGTIETRFFPPRLLVTSIGLTDPRRTDENAVAVDRLYIRLSGEPLLHRELVIEEAIVDGLKVNADRLTDGSLKPGNTAASSGLDLETMQKQLRLFGLRWYDELQACASRNFNPDSLETVRVCKAIETEWDRRIKDLESRIDGLQARIDTLRGEAAESRDPLEQLDSYSKAAGEVRSILAESNRIRSDVRSLPETVRRDITRIDAARRHDTVRLRERLTEIPVNPEEITKSILGPDFAQQLAAVNTWIRWMQRYLSFDTIEKAVPSERGEWIEFARTRRHPAVLLKSLTISGHATQDDQPFRIAGVCRGISSDPALYGKPTEWQFEMDGHSPLRIEGVSDLTLPTPKHEISFRWKAARPKPKMIGKKDRILLQLAAGSTECEGSFQIDGDHFHGELHLAQNPMTIAIGESSNATVNRWLASALASVRSAEATLQLAGTQDDLDWSISSNLGPQVAKGFQKLISKEIEAHRSKLLVRVNSVSRENAGRLEDLIGEQTQFLLADLNSRDTRAKQVLTRFTDGKLDLKKVGAKLDFGRLVR